MTQTNAPDFYHRIQAGPAQVRKMLDQARADARAAHVDPGLNDTAQIILGEVLNNVVEHAYDCVEGAPIELSIWLRDDGLWCEIRDDGLPMPNGVPPDGIAPEVDPKIPQDLPEGGFGWTLVREMTTDIQYRRQGGSNQLNFLIPRSTP